MNVIGLAIFLVTAALASASNTCNVRGNLPNEVNLVNALYAGDVRNGGNLIFPPDGALLTMAEAQKDDGSCFIKVAAKVDQSRADKHITGMSVAIGDKDCKNIVEADIIDSSPFISVKINGDSVTFETKAYGGNCANEIKIFKYGSSSKPSFVVKDMTCATKAKLNFGQNGVMVSHAEPGLNIRGPCGTQYQSPQE